MALTDKKYFNLLPFTVQLSKLISADSMINNASTINNAVEQIVNPTGAATPTKAPEEYSSDDWTKLFYIFGVIDEVGGVQEFAKVIKELNDAGLLEAISAHADASTTTGS